jgi:hypothetical protein
MHSHHDGQQYFLNSDTRFDAKQNEIISQTHGMQGGSGSNPLSSIFKNLLQRDFATVLERGI